MENLEKAGEKFEKLTPDGALALFDGIKPDRLALVDTIANKNGLSSLDMVKSFIEVHAEDYPNNPRLGEILKVLQLDSSEDAFKDKVEELIDLIK